MQEYAQSITEVAQPHIHVPDGTYSYRKVQLRGPALPITVTIHDGCLWALVSGEGADAQVCPTHRLHEVQAAALLELSWHLQHHLALHIEERLLGEVAA